MAWQMLECPRERGLTRRCIDALLIVLVIGNALAVVFGSDDDIHARYAPVFDWFEWASLAVFSLELGVRIWACVESPDRRGQSAWRQRLEFLTTPLVLIDILALVPALLHHLWGLDLRFVRLLRLLRMLKLARYSPALHALGAAFYAERRSFLGAGLIVAVLILLAASLLHLVEAEANPAGFGTLARSLWWAVVTLTTTGYGDVVPVTPLGRVLGGLCTILGLCLLALPAGIMANGFAEEIKRRDFVVNVKLVGQVPIFRGIDALHLAEIATMLRPRSVAPRALVVRAGDPSDCMYFVLQGELQVMIPTPVLLGPGSFFGEMGLLTKAPRSASVRAMVDSQLLVLDEQDFDRLMRLHPEVLAEIRRVAAERQTSPPPPRPALEARSQ
ncbi:MAG: cyclic nucleotide-gated ion channel [Alphaproteobacteria bacterium]|nr:cyclic nucleotide-gated ion channel [Alphaproteobacteria bacterium]